MTLAFILYMVFCTILGLWTICIDALDGYGLSVSDLLLVCFYCYVPGFNIVVVWVLLDHYGIMKRKIIKPKSRNR